ncbi:MAG: SURF1 family protein [Gammaproteobacteria bacterium]
MHSLISRHLPLFGGVLVVLMSAGFLRLGFWQLERARYKQELYAQYLANAAREVVPLAMLPSSEPDATLGRHVIVQGGYLPDRQILLDNQSLGGRAGYLVFTPFRPAAEPHEAILVNRGWIPLSASRDAVSLPPLSAGERTVHGELGRPPVSGLRLRGSDLIETLDGGIRRVQVIDYAALGSALGLRLQPRVLLLDPAVPEGFQRAWSAPGSDEARHRSYAFQWFAMAGALVAIYLTLYLKRRR